MRKKLAYIILGVAIVFGAASFVSADAEQVAMNKAEFVS